jgi:hypothetical protein
VCENIIWSLIFASTRKTIIPHSSPNKKKQFDQNEQDYANEQTNKQDKVGP